MTKERHRFSNWRLKNFAAQFVFVGILNGFALILAQPPQPSKACTDAMSRCEASTDCIHRLAALQSSCVTNTCQPQCRESAMNLYQNREGRQLLRSDASCVPGRYELEKCGFLPNKTPKHCSFAKLICESDLPCNAKWEVFVSECEAETNEGRCSDKCRKHLNMTLGTKSGSSLASCTCTDKDDNRCIQLREGALNTCLKTADKPEAPFFRPGMHPPESGENDVDLQEVESSAGTPDSASLTASNAFLTVFSSISLFFVARNCAFFT